MAQRAERAMSEDRQDVGHDFLEALRLVQSSCQVRRTAWDPSLLYLSLNRTRAGGD